MRVHRIVPILAIVMGGSLAVVGPAFPQEYRGTWEQQMACTPDVMRLCGDRIPDVSRIVACLRQNTALLGNACRAVFESNASLSQQSAAGLRQQTAPGPGVVLHHPLDADGE